MKLPSPRSLAVRTATAAARLRKRPRLTDPRGRSRTTAAQDTADTRLGKSVLSLAEAHPAESGVFALPDGRDAFAARALLADTAERTLDVQYYIWHNDMSGTLLFESLHRAADRGVRVRLLLDDNNTTGLDSLLAALDAHPNIEVRLFNAFRHRRWRALDYLTDFARLNRRMHNKSFTVDNQVTIVGGRNVGDEYFDAGQDIWFVDLDVMAVGPVVNDVSDDFDRYWASDSACPAGRVLRPAAPDAISGLSEAASLIERDPAALAYTRALARLPFVRELVESRLPFEWAPTRMVSDDPKKGLGRATGDGLLWSRLRRIIGMPARELKLVSAYFVPTAAGVDLFVELAERGVNATVLTNSLEATDVGAVHAGYARRRKPLLEAGVTLFEMKRASSTHSGKDRGVTGSSGSSLHAKTFSVDRSRVFIGSFNLDPRSAQLNTEMGIVIDSPALARAIADVLAGALPERAYKVSLNDGKLQWTEKLDGRTQVHDREPGTSFWQRFGVAVLAMLPIEWML